MNLHSRGKGSNRRWWWQPLRAWHLLLPSVTMSTCNVRCSLAVALYCEERSGYKNLVNRAAFQEQQNIRAGPCPEGTCQTTEDGLQLCLQPNTGEKLQGSLFTWIWSRGGEIWNWAQCKEEKSLPREKKSQPKATLLDSCGVCNADVWGSSEFKSQICAIPCKRGRNSGLQRKQSKEKVEHGEQETVQYVLHLPSLGGWDENSYGLIQ